MRTAPCKGCEKRHPYCHSECKDYADYSRERQEMLRRKKIDNEYAIVHDNRVIDSLFRKKKREKRR